MNKGLVQVYTGNGKGKTTAAIGLCVRAAGAGYSVLIVQLLKAMDSCEIDTLESMERIHITRLAMSKKFFWNMIQQEQIQCIEDTKDALNRALATIAHGAYDVVVFDEILGALACGIVTREDICYMLDTRSDSVEYIFTGRDAPDWLIDRADLVTEMRPIKHYFDTGQKARKGIEY